LEPFPAPGPLRVLKYAEDESRSSPAREERRMAMIADRCILRDASRSRRARGGMRQHQNRIPGEAENETQIKVSILSLNGLKFKTQNRGNRGKSQNLFVGKLLIRLIKLFHSAEPALVYCVINDFAHVR